MKKTRVLPLNSYITLPMANIVALIKCGLPPNPARSNVMYSLRAPNEKKKS